MHKLHIKFNIAIAITWGIISIHSNSYSQEIPEHYHPVRPNAMGGAFTAIANDENAVWTNPAGIARIRKARSRTRVNLLKFPNIIGGLNSQGKAFYDNAKAGQDEVLKTGDDVEDDKPFWGMGGVFPMMMFDMGSLPSVVGAFGHAIIKAVPLPSDVASGEITELETQVIVDTGAVFSLAWTNRTNRINLGFQIRAIRREAYEDTLQLSTLSNNEEMKRLFQENSNSSTAFAVDMGFMWTFADFWFPTFGISVLNLPLRCKKDYLNPFSKEREDVCGTVYSGDIKNPDAISTVDPTDIRVGLSITPRITRKIALRIAVDMHHIHYAMGSSNYGYSDIPIEKTLHGGVELFFGNPLTPSPFSVSVGTSQGYYTMGASVRWGMLSLDFASFGRDISSTDSPREDRRIMGSLSLDFI